VVQGGQVLLASIAAVLVGVVVECAAPSALAADAAVPQPGGRDIGALQVARTLLCADDGPVIIALPYPEPLVSGWDEGGDRCAPDRVELAPAALRAAGLAVVELDGVTVVAADEDAVLKVLGELRERRALRPPSEPKVAEVEGSGGEANALDPDARVSLDFVNAEVSGVCGYLTELLGWSCDLEGPATAEVTMTSGESPVEFVTGLDLMRISIELAGFEVELGEGVLRVRAQPGLVQPPPHSMAPALPVTSTQQQVRCPPTVTLAALEGATSGTDDLRQVLHRDADGEYDGVRLSAIRRGSVANLMGLNNGDVLTGLELPGRSAHDEGVAALLSELPVTGSVRFEVFRHNQPVSWSCEITE
jgi:hypothetical protein